MSNSESVLDYEYEVEHNIIHICSKNFKNWRASKNILINALVSINGLIYVSVDHNFGDELFVYKDETDQVHAINLTPTFREEYEEYAESDEDQPQRDFIDSIKRNIQYKKIKVQINSPLPQNVSV